MSPSGAHDTADAVLNAYLELPSRQPHPKDTPALMLTLLPGSLTHSSGTANCIFAIHDSQSTSANIPKQ